MPEVLGRIRATRGAVSAPRPTATADTFGAGTATALRGLAQSYAQFEQSEEAILNAEQALTRAHQARTNRQTRAAVGVDIIRSEAELGRNVEALRRDFPEGGSGFTEAVHSLVTDQIGSIQANIPEELRPEFAERLTRFEESFTTTAFETELAMGDAAYRDNVSELLEQAINEVTLGQAPIEQWREDLEDLLLTSPLAEAQTEVLAEQVIGTLDLMEYQQEAARIAEDPTLDTGQLPGPALGDDVMATGLPGTVRGLLNGGTGSTFGPAPDVTVTVAEHTGRPDERLLNILGHTASQVFGPGTRVEISSGHEGRSTGTRRHPAGMAADFQIVLPDGTALDYQDPRLPGPVQDFLFAAARNGIHGMGYGANYMGHNFHMDIFPPSMYRGGEGHLWAELGNVPGLMEEIQRYDGEISPNTYGEETSHPGGAEVAGRYELSADAWTRAQATLGLENFSPANQDRATWWLAAEAYSEVTGRNLQNDLNSQDPVLIENARQVILENSEGFAIPGLGEMSRQDFYDRVTLSSPTLPGVMFDERFANVPVQDRIEIFTEQQAAMSSQLAARQQAADAQRSSFITDLEAQIELGVAGQQDVIRANEQYGFRATEMVQLVNALEARENTETTAASFSSRLSSGDSMFFFDSGQAGEREAANTYSQMAHREAIESQDLGMFNQQVLGDISQMGWVPDPVTQALVRGSRSATPAEQDFAYGAMSNIYAQDPVLFEQTFGSDITRGMRFFTSAAGASLPREERMARINQLMSPEGAQIEERVSSVLRSTQRDHPDWFAPSTIAGNIDDSWGQQDSFSPTAARALEQEFTDLFREELRLWGDPVEAREAAQEALQIIWGETQLGNEDGYVMRRPVERYYPADLDGSHSWVDEQVREELNLEAGISYRLVSDNITEADIASGRQPSYFVTTINESGLYTPVMDGTLPARIQFDRSDEVRQEHVDEAVNRNTVFRAGERLADALVYYQRRDDFAPAQQDSLDEIRLQVGRILEVEPDAGDRLRYQINSMGITDPGTIDYIFGENQ